MLKKLLVPAVVLTIVGTLSWFFVVSPVYGWIAEENLRRDVKIYEKEVEESIVESTFGWVNTSPKGFSRDDDHERRNLIERMSRLRSGGGTQFSQFESDSWERLHRDILEELSWSARRRAEADLGTDRNNVEWETTKRYMPDGWEKRMELHKLHNRLGGCYYGYKQTPAELRAKFDEIRLAIDTLMDELKIDKQK